MQIKANDQWFDPEDKDKVMLVFMDKKDKEYVISCIQNMPEEAQCLAFFPDDHTETKEEMIAWMKEPKIG